MIASWYMARRRASARTRPGAVAVVWPLLVDVVALACFAVLIMGIVVSSAYAEPRNDGPWPIVAMLGGIVIFAGCLSNALVTTWRAFRAR